MQKKLRRRTLWGKFLAGKVEARGGNYDIEAFGESFCMSQLTNSQDLKRGVPQKTFSTLGE